MANRHSDVNNCPNDGNKLWLSKHGKQYWYTCLHCGYQVELEQPKLTVPQTVFETQSFWDDVAVAAYNDALEE